jgi:hypothetical protein
MADNETTAPAESAAERRERAEPAPVPDRIYLVPYPKIVFLYPTFVMALVAATVLSIVEAPLDPTKPVVVAISIVFQCVLAVNLVILAFDFPRTTSLTLFFFMAAVVMGLVLLFTFQPQLLPAVGGFLKRYRPLANPTFYWSVSGILAAIYLVVFFNLRFDYWEVRANELLHHHGFLSNIERFPSPHLRIDKEIVDVFEFFLLRSGRLILQPSEERRAIILDNVPFIDRKEGEITRMLSALQVQVRNDRG